MTPTPLYSTQLPDLFWAIEIAILCAACFVVTWYWRSNLPVAISALIVMLPVMWITTYQCLYVEGPYGIFEAPYNPEVVARRAVDAVGGELDEMKPDVVSITLAGRQIDDKVLEKLIPYLKDLSVVYLSLKNTSVTCAGATSFEHSMQQCEVFGLAPGCDASKQ